MGASLNARRRRAGFPFLLTFSILLAVSAIGLLVYYLVTFSRREQESPAGVTVAGINVGQLSERNAVARWERAYAEPILLVYSNDLGDHPIQLHPDQVGWRISSEPMLAGALASGQEGGGFWRRFLDFLLGIELSVSEDIPLVADYQDNALEAFLRDVAARYDDRPGSATFDLETLTIYPGGSGYALDVAAAMPAVDDSMSPEIGHDGWAGAARPLGTWPCLVGRSGRRWPRRRPCSSHTAGTASRRRSRRSRCRRAHNRGSGVRR